MDRLYKAARQVCLFHTATFFVCLFWLTCTAWASWQTEWERTVAAARKEGQVAVYMSSYKQSIEVFKKEYPGIKVLSVTARPAGLMGRITAERRAGKYIPDVLIVGPGTQTYFRKHGALDSIKNAFILPEVEDETKWLGGKHGFLDAGGKYIFLYAARPSGAFAYNVNLVNPKEFSSYWDVLKPRWKGKIVSLDPREVGIGQPLMFFYHTPHLGPEYIQKFYGTMDVTLSKSVRQMIDWLGHGKFSFCLGCKRLRTAKNQGLPVDSFTGNTWKKDGAYISGGGSMMSLVNRGPNPNAAKVFINWFLSRRGQIEMQRLSRGTPPNSRRIDIPKDDVPVEYRLVKGATYFDVDQPQYADMTSLENFIKKIIKQSRRRR